MDWRTFRTLAFCTGNVTKTYHKNIYIYIYLYLYTFTDAWDKDWCVDSCVATKEIRSRHFSKGDLRICHFLDTKDARNYCKPHGSSFMSLWICWVWLPCHGSWWIIHSFGKSTYEYNKFWKKTFHKPNFWKIGRFETMNLIIPYI